MDINGLGVQIIVNKIIMDEFTDESKDSFSQELSKKETEPTPQKIIEIPEKNNINNLLFALLSNQHIIQDQQNHPPPAVLKCTCKKIYNEKNPEGYLVKDPSCPIHDSDEKN